MERVKGRLLLASNLLCSIGSLYLSLGKGPEVPSNRMLAEQVSARVLERESEAIHLRRVPTNDTPQSKLPFIKPTALNPNLKRAQDVKKKMNENYRQAAKACIRVRVEILLSQRLEGKGWAKAKPVEVSVLWIFAVKKSCLYFSSCLA